jgi:methionine sulfoxide reductase heme-binding subunit
MTSGRELWYLTRGSGAVALVLLTGAVVLGVLASARVRSGRWPAFAIGRTHRNLTLLAIVFVALHVVTTVADGYAPIGLKDAVLPFASPYRPVWLGLGAVAFDLLLALVVSSLLRRRLGFTAWRAIHWLAYASWPIALVHALGTGSDARAPWLVGLGVGALIIVAAAVAARLTLLGGPAPLRAAAGISAVAVPLVIGVWYGHGPARPGWAARAGTPQHLRAAASTSRGRTLYAAAPAAPQDFAARVSGTIRSRNAADGRIHISISLRLDGGPGGALRLALRGRPAGDGVAMDASGVSFVPATTGAPYLGSVTALDGNLVGARVRDAAGDTLDLALTLALGASSGVARGTVQAAAPAGEGSD